MISKLLWVLGLGGGLCLFWPPEKAVLIFLAWLGHEAGHLLGSRLLGVELECWSLTLPASCQGWREAALAAAGPLMNIFFWGSGFFLSHGQSWQELNLLVGGFNLLPVLPLDGGRIVRGLGSSFCPWLKMSHFLCALSLPVSLFLTGASMLLKLWWLLPLAIVIYVLAWREKNGLEALLWLAWCGSKLTACPHWVMVGNDLTVSDCLNQASPGWDWHFYLAGGYYVSAADLRSLYVSGNGARKVGSFKE